MTRLRDRLRTLGAAIGLAVLLLIHRDETKRRDDDPNGVWR